MALDRAAFQNALTNPRLNAQTCSSFNFGTSGNENICETRCSVQAPYLIQQRHVLFFTDGLGLLEVRLSATAATYTGIPEDSTLLSPPPFNMLHATA
jgi:hypothetical protein